MCVAAVATLIVACNNETDTTLTTQQDSITRYLTSSHQPRLIAEEDLGTSLDSEPQYYTHWGLDIYRYISTMYAEGRESWTEADRDDIVEISFDAYVFNYSNPSGTTPYWSNRQVTIDRFVATNNYFDPQYWSTDPYVIRLDSEDGMPGLRRALVGCREGDTVEIYMTYQTAYNKQIIGTVPKFSPVVWLLKVDRVTKK